MDNDPKHKSKLVQSYLKRKSVSILDWPSQSLDLNPIENLWAELDRRTKFRRVTNGNDLFKAISEEWKQIDNNYLQNLVNSMPKRIKEVLKKNGNSINY